MPRMTIEISTEHAALIEDEVNSGRVSTRNEAVAAVIREAYAFANWRNSVDSQKRESIAESLFL